jgi:hypothetical protein
MFHRVSVDVSDNNSISVDPMSVHVHVHMSTITYPFPLVYNNAPLNNDVFLLPILLFFIFNQYYSPYIR